MVSVACEIEWDPELVGTLEVEITEKKAARKRSNGGICEHGNEICLSADYHQERLCEE